MAVGCRDNRGPIWEESAGVHGAGHRFEARLAGVAVSQPFAVRAIHHYAACGQVQAGIDVGIVDLLEEFVRAIETARAAEVVADPVAGDIRQRQQAVDAVDGRVAASVIAKMVAEGARPLARRRYSSRWLNWHSIAGLYDCEMEIELPGGPFNVASIHPA